ncbi:MAG: DUF393 domain-containing protein [Phycisphaera sp.]|nr:DUF393 domain-containing protein [Phycisphaera sp.]
MADWQIRMLYDGECPACRREVDMLRRRDTRQQIDFEDIAAAGFDAGRYGLTAERVRAVLHGVLPDGSVVTGMEVVRRAYRAIGLGWVWAPTGWPVLRWFSDRAYDVWAAQIRPRLVRRRCDDGGCAVNATPTAAKDRD